MATEQRTSAPAPSVPSGAGRRLFGRLRPHGAASVPTVSNGALTVGSPGTSPTQAPQDEHGRKRRWHRSGVTSGHDQHVAAQASISEPEVPTYTWLQNLGIALVSMVYVFGVAIATMLLGGVVLHAISPSHTFDIFYAFRNQLVVGILLGLGLFWLAPPYPWAGKQPKRTGASEPAAPAGGKGAESS